MSVEPYLGGDIIMDLGREDFEVFEDGVLRPITHFERVLGGRAETPPESTVAKVESVPITEVPEVLQYTVLAFDAGSLSHLRLQRTIRQTQVFLREQAAPSARWAVVVLGANSQVLLPFTSDHRKVEAALDSLKGLWRGVPVAGWGGAGSFLDGEKVVPEAPLPTDSERREALQSVDTLKGNLENNLARFRERELFDSLSELFRGWASLDGSKSLVMYYEPGLI
ncbi:MAG: hypothetical protein K8H90_04015, partial [Thermoanaerobaculia bacterium]|nr:hypothetical protein [Thermoanaerobaculia bacterium]